MAEFLTLRSSQGLLVCAWGKTWGDVFASMTEYDGVLRGEFINFYRPVNTPAPLA